MNEDKVVIAFVFIIGVTVSLMCYLNYQTDTKAVEFGLQQCLEGTHTLWKKECK